MNWSELLQDLRIPFVEEGDHEHARHGWIQIDCPFCSPGIGHYRLGIHESSGASNCWACGPHSTGVALARITEYSWKKVRELLGNVTRTKIKEEIDRRGTLKLPHSLNPLTANQKLYLRLRGFSWRELVKLWRLQGVNWHRRYGWRIFIPIYFRGEIVSFTTRSIDDDAKLRYLVASPEEEAVNHRSILYGEDYCKHSIVICEGPTDVWRIGPGAVCTFGTGWTKKQLLRAIKYPVRAVCYDTEKFAQKRAERLCDYLSSFNGQTHNVRLDSWKDPGGASPEEIETLRKHFLWEY